MKFNLKDKVIISVTGTPATVIGRSEYIDYPNSYWLLFADGQGNPREEWWSEARIESAPTPVTTTEAPVAA